MGAIIDNPIQLALNAISNASRVPISEAEAAQVLSTGDGHGSHVRALFGDCSAETLARLAMHVGVEPETLKEAYANAKSRHAASNEDLEDALSLEA